MTSSAVTIQFSPQSVPSVPSWFGEATVMARALAHFGVLTHIQERVRFARPRFGTYDVIDFVAVLIGYTLSGEPTLEAFYTRLMPFADAFMALFGRDRLPHRSTFSRFLAALDQPTVEALRTLFQEDLVARSPFATPPGGVWDRQGQHWLVVDVDGTRQAARQRALPHTPELPAPHRRFDQVCAPGYLGHRRGEVVRTRTVVLQAHTHQWLGSVGNAGNGNYRAELLRARDAIASYATALSLPLAQVLVRLDGLYGNAAPLADLLTPGGLGVIVRGKEYDLLDLPSVQQRLQQPPDQQTTHPESGTSRALFDCRDIALTPTGPVVRMILATHPASASPPPIGVVRNETVYEQFFTTVPPHAWTPADVLHLYLHRGSFEITLADEDQEQDPDRWFSHTPCGQEFCQILSQWIWNVRLELGQKLVPTSMRLTDFTPALAVSPAPPAQPAHPEEPPPTTQSTQGEENVSYGPPQWARPSYTKGFAGADFALQPDGTLRCPAGHPLYAQERRSERNGSVRVLYAARIGHCRVCPLRERCQESGTTLKPRRVSAVLWPISSSLPGSGEALPVRQEALAPPPGNLILWGDWERCQIRRSFLTLLRTQTVTVTQCAPQDRNVEETEGRTPAVLTRAQRAHWRLGWAQRLARNARSASAPALTITVHGLPSAFAQHFGCSPSASSVA